MKQFNAIQYIAIDIGNCYGLDKLNYEDRIQWVKTNLDKLEDLQAQAEEPFLYYKAVRALRDGMAGLPINHHVALDSASSGLQLMSVMMRDKEGCYLTGLIDPDNRMDAYTLICDEMNRLMAEDGLEEVFVTRKQAKEAVMCGLYGSVAVPERVFGKVLLPYFYKALDNKASGAMNLLAILKGSWNSVESSHTWTMPDGHYVQIPIMQMEDKRISIKEINYSPVARMAFNIPKKKGVSNIANMVHSVDAYVLRSLVRRCNYDKFVVENFMAISRAVIYQTTDESLPNVKRYKATKMADLTMLADITYNNVKYYPKELIQALRAICESVLIHKPFELIVIHDSFAAHPNNCNFLRQHYNNILAELSDSNVVCDILNQLYQDGDFENENESISELIRNSNYGIC